MITRRTIAGIAILSAVHFVALVIAFSMFWWEPFSPPSALERVAQGVALVLCFPAILCRTSNDVVEWVLIVGNSLQWGVLLYFLLREFPRVVRRRQVSLRWMLMLVTLVAVLLGIWVCVSP